MFAKEVVITNINDDVVELCDMIDRNNNVSSMFILGILI